MSTNMNYYEQEQVRAIISDSGINIFYKTCMRQVGVINAECKHCKKKMKLKSISKHFINCSPNSPLFQGSVMCDGGDDIIVYKVKKSI